jgi:ABC-type oligopeptide transport system substrate-binding subunit
MYTWTDPKFDEEFTKANSMVDQALRMNALAACEAQLMKAMPSVPIFHDNWAYLEAPYLRGMKPNPFGAARFKYAWIDTNWRPS